MCSTLPLKFEPSSSVIAFTACSGNMKVTVAKPLARRVCLQMGNLGNNDFNLVEGRIEAQRLGCGAHQLPLKFIRSNSRVKWTWGASSRGRMDLLPGMACRLFGREALSYHSTRQDVLGIYQ
ncbi:hypothetical protein E2C01_015732 [Portunus trituberculatus]|uniref:Uncharacterized protein n=1 Tax=Portunus trituberculatus TaxID=210409 RepID=A0A5B7DMA7_PORTR|nr:hypothetical protein [Portunus trituberculatus]